jgi:hypothetical protein
MSESASRTVAKREHTAMISQPRLSEIRPVIFEGIPRSLIEKESIRCGEVELDIGGNCDPRFATQKECGQRMKDS